MNQYIQPTACSNCPFNESGEGRHLRDSLNEGRFSAIKNDLMNRMVFHCHQTTGNEDEETGEVDTSSALICAGALAFQRQHNKVPDAIQVAERISAMNEHRRARF